MKNKSKIIYGIILVIVLSVIIYAIAGEKATTTQLDVTVQKGRFEILVTVTGELQEIVDRAALGTVSDYARELLWSGTTAPDELRKTLDMFEFGKRLGAGGKTVVPLRRSEPDAQAAPQPEGAPTGHEC